MTRTPLGLVILLAWPALAVASPSICAPGRFLFDGTAGPLLTALLGTTDPAVVIGGRTELGLGGCGPARAELRPGRVRGKSFTRVRARWRRCGDLARVELRGRIADPDCSVLDGSVKARKRRKEAVRLVRSSCGDTRLDTTGGETCDASATNGGDAACPAGCRPATDTAACTCDPLVVMTAAGAVRGKSADGVRSFLGIPYAASTAGAHRWRPPAPPEPWTAVRDATVAGPSCPQTIPIVNTPTGAEDCLVANVFTPDPVPASPRPVMVWIHGGAFTTGDARQYVGGTDGDVIVRKSDTVQVGINYRLGPFGFLAHPALSAEDAGHPSSGNYGFEDQVAALRWVHDNIAAFGGDPNNVTIFGESAGGWSVCLHLASPASSGLFQRAIVESGLCVQPMASLAASEAQGMTFAQHIGCDGAADVVACMRAKPIDEVRNALPPDPNFAFTPGTWGFYSPVVDGAVIPGQVADALGGGAINQVPVLIGSNRDEGTLFVMLARDRLGMPVTADDYDDLLLYLLLDPAFVAQAIAHYPLASYPTPGAALSAAFGDALLACPTIDAAHLLAPRVPTFLYQFEYPDAPFAIPSPVPLGAFHSAEVQYVFGRSTGTGFTPVEQAMSDAMIGYWTRFAATGDPNGGGAPAWPALDGADGHLVLDATIAASSGAKHDACTFWAGLDYRRPPLQ